MSDPDRKRAPSLDTTARRRDAALVAPFARQIGRLQVRAAHLDGLLTTGRMDDAQLNAAALELEELTSAVRSLREGFADSTLDKLQWSRVRDVSMALERLAGRLADLDLRLARSAPARRGSGYDPTAQTRPLAPPDR